VLINIWRTRDIREGGLMRKKRRRIRRRIRRMTWIGEGGGGRGEAKDLYGKSKEGGC